MADPAAPAPITSLFVAVVQVYVAVPIALLTVVHAVQPRSVPAEPLSWNPAAQVTAVIPAAPAALHVLAVESLTAAHSVRTKQQQSTAVALSTGE